MVTWGTNTVHTFGGTPAPAAGGFNFGAPAPATGGGLFGSPSPSSGGLFGSKPSSGSLFGSPSPAPTGGGLFGSSPAPTGGLFGSAPAPSGGGLFGSTPSPAGGGLFGSSPAPAGGGLFGGGGFGSTTPASPFGGSAAQQQQPQQQWIPAEAALHAHMDAAARQEEHRVQTRLQKLYSSYEGTAVANQDDKSCDFSVILYTDASQAVLQQQWIVGSASGRSTPRPIAPPRPLQISERDWNQAVVRNPDPSKYMPTAIVGAVALQARLSYQQTKGQACQDQLKLLQDTLELVQNRHEQVLQRLSVLAHKYQLQRLRLLSVLRKVELSRCMNMPLSSDELHLWKQLSALQQQVENLRSNMQRLADGAKKLSRQQQPRESNTDSMVVLGKHEQEQLFPVLKEHRSGIAKLTETMNRDLRDLKLIQERVDSTMARVVPGR